LVTINFTSSRSKSYLEKGGSPSTQDLAAAQLTGMEPSTLASGMRKKKALQAHLNSGIRAKKASLSGCCVKASSTTLRNVMGASSLSDGKEAHGRGTACGFTPENSIARGDRNGDLVPGRALPPPAPDASVGVEVKVADERLHLRQLQGTHAGPSKMRKVSILEHQPRRKAGSVRNTASGCASLALHGLHRGCSPLG
jgi:hypothetical protein